MSAGGRGAKLARVMSLRLLPPALVVAFAIAVAPASAETFCAPAPCADGVPKATIEAAVAAADDRAGPDVVSIKAGSFMLDRGRYGMGLAVGAADTEIHGAGRDATILTTAALESDFGGSRTLISGYMSRIADLTLRLPSAVTPGHNASIAGLDVYDGVVERVRVDAAGAQIGPGANDGEAQGMLVRHGSIHDIVIDLPRDADTSGLRLGGINANVDVDGADVTANWAVDSSPQTDSPAPIATMTARRMHIRGGKGALNVSDGRFELTDAIIETTGNRAAASVYSGRSPVPATLIMDRVTLLGPGTAGSVALSNGGHDPETTTTLRARHVLAAGFGTSLELSRGGGRLVSSVDFSALPPTVREDEHDGVVETSFTSVRSGARAAIDIGGEPLLGSFPSLDLAGAPRLHDGDGDGIAQIDAGAEEYQGGPPQRDPATGPGFPSPSPSPAPRPTPRDTAAPRISALRASAKRRVLTVRYTLDEAATVKLVVERKTTGRRSGSTCVKASSAKRGAKPCTRWVPVQTITRKQPAGTQSVASKALRRGAHRVLVTATDAAGNRGRPKSAAAQARR
jgi:hypothetical protein